jgi:hypothetical protein
MDLSRRFEGPPTIINRLKYIKMNLFSRIFEGPPTVINRLTYMKMNLFNHSLAGDFEAI